MMKKLFLLQIVLFFILISCSTVENDWENPQIIGINKEKPRSTFIIYDNIDDVVEDQYSNSPYYLLLNGMWKFNWVEKPSKKPDNFYLDEYSVDNWAEIPVPSDWQMHGYGYPIYSNITS